MPWLKQLEKENISVSTASPFIHKDLLIGKNLGIDGSAIEETEFVYGHPHVRSFTHIAHVRTSPCFHCVYGKASVVSKFYVNVLYLFIYINNKEEK